VNAGIVGEAAALFAVTNVDDIVVLSLYFGRGAGQDRAASRITAGQYLGFTAILALTVAAAYGATFLPGSAIAYLGLLPLALGLLAAWQAWHDRRHRDRAGRQDERRPGEPGVFQVAAVALANGSDNIGAYLPVFAKAGAAGIAVYAVVFLVLTGAWCAAARYLAARPAVARVLGRWGHVLHPLVLTALGLFLLIQGGAFGL
jgi:cadmium resistance protein CadD (predicted permease)